MPSWATPPSTAPGRFCCAKPKKIRVPRQPCTHAPTRAYKAHRHMDGRADALSPASTPRNPQRMDRCSHAMCHLYSISDGMFDRMFDSKLGRMSIGILDRKLFAMLHQFSIVCSLECLIEYSMKCSTECSIRRSIECPKACSQSTPSCSGPSRARKLFFGIRVGVSDAYCKGTCPPVLEQSRRELFNGAWPMLMRICTHVHTHVHTLQPIINSIATALRILASNEHLAAVITDRFVYTGPAERIK